MSTSVLNNNNNIEPSPSSNMDASVNDSTTSTSGSASNNNNNTNNSTASNQQSSIVSTSMVGAPTSVVVSVSHSSNNNNNISNNNNNNQASAIPSTSSGSSSSQYSQDTTATEGTSSSSSNSTFDLLQTLNMVQNVVAHSPLIQMSSSSPGTSSLSQSLVEVVSDSQQPNEIMKRTYEIFRDSISTKIYLDQCKRSKTMSLTSPTIASKSPEDGLTLRQKLEQRLNGILCCAVCLDLPKSSIYQVCFMFFFLFFLFHFDIDQFSILES